MKNGVNVLLVWLGIIALSINAHAAVEPIITAYAHAQIEETQSIQEKDYRLVLGKVDVVNNSLRIRQEKRIDVIGNSYLYRVTPGYSSQDAYNDALSKLSTRGANIVFKCSGRDCGDSNSWANSVFGKAELYGKEREQNYVVAELLEQGKKLYVIAFTIKRGNGRVYLYTEELFSTDTVASKSDSAASAQDRYVAVRFEGEAELLQKLNQLSADDLIKVRRDQTKTAISSVWLGLQLRDFNASYGQLFTASKALLEKIKPTIARRIANAEIRFIPLGSLYMDTGISNELRIYVE